MNKLINLIIIFLCLRFVIPTIFSSVDVLSKHREYYNLFAGLFIVCVQITYNLWKKYKKNRQLTYKNVFLNSLFSGLIVTTGYYILDDIQTRVQINSQLDAETIKSSFVIIILMLYILINSLLMP